MLPIYTLHRGSRPLLISIPHAGTEVPAELAARFSSAGRRLPDTDWHVDQLYGFARELGASVLCANYSRYVVDLNRSADSRPLYQSSVTTPVCPLQTFSGEAIYSGPEPDEAEVRARLHEYWSPYHQALRRELERFVEEHQCASLWDAHSIASEVPELFAGVLPQFNFGTRDDASCPRAIATRVIDCLEENGFDSVVLNGRFKGGYITHHYGQPAQRRYAIQLELAQRTYVDEAEPTVWRPAKSAATSAVLCALLERYMIASGSVGPAC